MYRENYKRLIATILLKAVSDAKGTGRGQSDAREAARFASSPWCEALCECVNVPYDQYRDKVRDEAKKHLSRQKRLEMPV